MFPAYFRSQHPDHIDQISARNMRTKLSVISTPFLNRIVWIHHGDFKEMVTLFPNFLFHYIHNNLWIISIETKWEFCFSYLTISAILTKETFAGRRCVSTVIAATTVVEIRRSLRLQPTFCCSWGSELPTRDPPNMSSTKNSWSLHEAQHLIFAK